MQITGSTERAPATFLNPIFEMPPDGRAVLCICVWPDGTQLFIAAVKYNGVLTPTVCMHRGGPEESLFEDVVVIGWRSIEPQ